MVPDSLQRVELRRGGRAIVHLDVSAVIREPGPDLPVFVVGRVVLHEMYSARNVLAKDSFQVRDGGLGVEHLLEWVANPGGVPLDGAEDFEGVALAGREDFRLRPYPGPGLIEGGVLAEGGLVPKEDSRSLAVGFFSRRGIDSGPSEIEGPGRPAPVSSWDAEPKTQVRGGVWKHGQDE